MQKPRRTLLKLTTATLLFPSISTLAATLPKTPEQTPGPFYPSKIPQDADADLVQVEGQSREATGIICHLTGKVLDPNGCPIKHAIIEIWQCDAFGAYHHHRDRGNIAEPEFQGYGFRQTSEMGEYRFRTITPASYPGRAPHIHIKVSQPGMKSLTTQLYVKGEQQNQHDFLFNSIPENKRAYMQASFPTSATESNSIIPEFNIIMGQTVDC